MIKRLALYPASKDSGVAWLGAVPEHWQVLPGRACYREKKLLNTGLKETQVLSLSFGRIVIKPPEKLHGLVPASFETYQIVDPGDIIVRPTDLQNDWNSLRFGISRDRGIITSAYLCFLTRDVITRDFGHLLLHAYDLKKVFYGLGSGLRQNLDWDDFRRLPCLVPTIPEQDAIVRFLDHADRRIGRAIRAKQKLIALLNEQTQSVIHRAVTRGLDPNVRLKPSGADWLGEVPEHWQVRQVNRFARVGNGSTPSRSNPAYWTAGSYPWLNSASVNRHRISASDQFVTDVALEECHLPRVAPGSVLLAITGQGKTRGTAAVLLVEATISQHIAYITPRSDIVMTEYLQLAFAAAYRELRRISDDSGSTKGALTCRDVAHFKVALPNLDEQAQILRAVETQNHRCEQTLRQAALQIDLLREYRSRLMADVVTGKLDVREAAARLPDEAEEPELIDEAELDGDELVEGEVSDEALQEVEA